MWGFGWWLVTCLVVNDGRAAAEALQQESRSRKRTAGGGGGVGPVPSLHFSSPAHDDVDVVPLSPSADDDVPVYRQHHHDVVRFGRMSLTVAVVGACRETAATRSLPTLPKPPCAACVARGHRPLHVAGLATRESATYVQRNLYVSAS